MKRKQFFQLFHLALILIEMTEAGKLCDFAAKFPCKGSHCLPSPCTSKTMQETEEPITAVPTELIGKTMQETEEPITAVPTKLIGPLMYTCPPNMIYGNCTCEATCEDPKGESACNSTCLTSKGCICKAGFMLNGSDCINAIECGCFVTDVNLVIPSGQTYVNDDCTHKCSCSNNQLICEDEYNCSTNAVCDVKNKVRQCYCNEGYEGDGETCVSLPYRDCQDVYDAGHRQDGVYTIMPTRDGLVYHSTYLVTWKTVEDGPCFNVVPMALRVSIKTGLRTKTGLVTAGTYG
ncbi:zonadhesin-like isoform X2 [Apostichopus japonicus]|uniref:zonadhesin-like isoform X2 n=1 Tax=Stichopus japonicus TaxID=307972 RepID=UPI003AB4B140